MATPTPTSAEEYIAANSSRIKEMKEEYARKSDYHNRRLGVRSEAEYVARQVDIQLKSGGSLEDRIFSDGGRHQPFFPRADELWKATYDFEVGSKYWGKGLGVTDSWAELGSGRRSIQLSYLNKPNERSYVVLHPSYERMGRISKFAYAELAHAINTWDEDEDTAKDKIANAYRLLCHATPFMNGSPSIVENFLDGFLRSKGVALPLKTGEPFWHAIFWQDAQGPYTWDHFMSNFEGDLIHTAD